MGLISICTLSPSIFLSCFPAEEAREFCCSATLAAISKLFYGIFFLIFGMVGAILGALTGAFVGAKTKTGCLHGATVGAVKGSHLSIKFFKISVEVCSSDDVTTRYLFQPMNPTDSTFNEIHWIISRGLSEESMKKIPKIKITEENAWDSCRNRVSCSICLQDFSKGETVHSLPHCHHMFHVSCIQKWLIGHRSCPLCRRNF